MSNNAEVQTLLCLGLTIHPFGHGDTCIFLKGRAKGAITTETTLLGQLCQYDWVGFCNSLAVETNKMIDTQAVDIGVIGFMTPYIPNNAMGIIATATGQSGRFRSCIMRKSIHIIKGTKVRRSSVMATILRTNLSSVKKSQYRTFRIYKTVPKFTKTS